MNLEVVAVSARGIAFAVTFALTLISSQSVEATTGATPNISPTYVKGHFIKSGKYVQGHQRSKPDKQHRNKSGKASHKVASPKLQG